MLLTELLQHTPEQHVDHANLVKAVETVSQAASQVRAPGVASHAAITIAH